MELCTDEDASDLKEDMDNVTSKYDAVKSKVRSKLCEMEEAFRSVTVEVSDYCGTCIHIYCTSMSIHVCITLIYMYMYIIV